jgi:chromosome partitioning protein
MKTIVCGIQKGGQGKSMLATHLAFLAAEQGRRVLVVDLDGQGNCSKNLVAEEFDRDLCPTVQLFEGRFKKPFNVSLPYPVSGSIALCSGDRRLEKVDETPKIGAELLKKAISTFAGDYDLCVIDPPPSLGKRLRASLIAANFVVMPFELKRESIDGLGDLLDTIEEVKQASNPDLHVVGLLANKVNNRSDEQKKSLADIRREAGQMLLPMTIAERMSIASAMAVSRPIWRFSGGASQRQAAKEVRAACAHILKTVFKK